MHAEVQTTPADYRKQRRRIRAPRFSSTPRNPPTSPARINIGRLDLLARRQQIAGAQQSSGCTRRSEGLRSDRLASNRKLGVAKRRSPASNPRSSLANAETALDTMPIDRVANTIASTAGIQGDSRARYSPGAANQTRQQKWIVILAPRHRGDEYVAPETGASSIQEACMNIPDCPCIPRSVGKHFHMLDN